jgi:uroporphyrin-III C-methyltransferase
VEVINGITSGLAAPSAIGVPLTHRDHSQGVILVTGHGKSADAEPDWAALARLDLTLVVYMGIGRCGDIVSALIAGGKPAHTPAAVIHAATGSAQAQLITTLADLPAALAASGLGSPGIIVIGEVVRCAEQLQALSTRQACAA